MIPYPLSARRVIGRFTEALVHDDFRFTRPPSEVQFASMDAFLRMFQANPRTAEVSLFEHPDVSSLTATFADLLQHSAKLGGTTFAIADMIAIEFCIEPFNALLHDVSRGNIQDEMRECGVRSTAAWLQVMRSEAVAPVLLEHLFKQMVTHLGDRTLLSFFVKPAPDNAFRCLGSWNYSCSGSRLRPTVLALNADLGSK